MTEVMKHYDDYDLKYVVEYDIQHMRYAIHRIETYDGATRTQAAYMSEHEYADHVLRAQKKHGL